VAVVGSVAAADSVVAASAVVVLEAVGKTSRDLLKVIVENGEDNKSHFMLLRFCVEGGQVHPQA